ncbi:Lrp/AsnC family transcriptional regulator [Emcibacter sp.]|uniref:Lrp/AsnC family transcriptional regulator n=1 Tax=Emcibacter sp. TaxID=1979954 RepID=UPI002AA66CA3|nr:Lrp/AsnC family transcriptional regulator [Emcibacter sp.]
MDNLDRSLLEILTLDARKSISTLAGALKVSRATVTDRISKLEQRGIIEGYTLRINREFSPKKITAHVMITVVPKLETQVIEQLKKIHGIQSIFTVSGMYDLIAVLQKDSTEELDSEIDFIRETAGVEKTVTNVILSAKLDNNR